MDLVNGTAFLNETKSMNETILVKKNKNKKVVYNKAFFFRLLVLVEEIKVCNCRKASA